LLLLGIPLTLPGEFRLAVPDLSVGKNLQASSTVTLLEAAPQEGLDITLRSSDPARLLLSKTPLEAGSPSIVLHVRAQFRESPEFWLQGQSDQGSVTCTASTSGYADAAATISLTPSAIVIAGPYRATELQTTIGAPPIRLMLATARLDASLNYAEEQLLAVNPEIAIQLTSSNKAAGSLVSTSVVIKMASSSAVTEFLATDRGETLLAAGPPPGFTKPAQFAAVKAVVQFPGLAVSDHLRIGRDLQVAGVLSLGAAAPGAGVAVTLESADPQRLLLSNSATIPGSGSITVMIAKGGASSTYYLQALAGDGAVTYTAKAKGFRTRTAEVSLTPAGVVLTPAYQGPPDEAQVLRPSAGVGDGNHTVVADLKSNNKAPLMAWTVQLDPVTHRGADITVQPLRAGKALMIALTNSHPNVGRVPTPLKIAGGSEHSKAEFEALSTGSTVISVETPAGFTMSANSTSVTAVVAP